MRFLHWLPLTLALAAPLSAQQILSVAGNVTLRPADAAPWTPATAGAPVTNGTSISVAAKAAAEIRLEASDSFRAAASSQFRFGGVENEKYQLQLSFGKITYQAADPSVDSMRVNLPGVAVEPAQPGIYTIAQAAGGQSEITVEAGLARVVAPNGVQLINAGQKMMIRYTAAGPEFRMVNAFSRWRRFLTVVGSAVQVASVMSTVSGGAGDSAAARKTATIPKRTTEATKPVDTHQRTEPPAKSGPPPAAPPAASKTK